MKPIGGFFELELSKTSLQYHKDALPLWCGRACLNLILSKTEPIKIYVPFYTCNALLEPILESKLCYEFYGLNNDLTISDEPKLKKNEYLIYINYFGLKTNYVHHLVEKYKDQIIIDNSQAFFERGYSDGWSFNSCRKFFGVPDGGYLYSNTSLDMNQERNGKSEYDHLVLRLQGNLDRAFELFQQNEEIFNSEILKMSTLTQNILAAVDYYSVEQQRKLNFKLYHQKLKDFNELPFVSEDSGCIPFCYPLLVERPINREELFKENIFIPWLWKDVYYRDSVKFNFEKRLAENILCLPCDQRYNADDINHVINLIKQCI